MRGLGGMREWFAVEEEGKARGSKALQSGGDRMYEALFSSV